MWIINGEMAVPLLAWLLSLYLLIVLAQLHYIHRSPAWAFIFTGLGLLALECMGLVLERAGLLNLPRYALDLVVLAKAVCYAIGFTIWKRNLQFNSIRRRMEMDQDRDDEARRAPDHLDQERPGGPAPETPQPPTPQKPDTPKGPPVRPQGDVPGPGGSGGGGGQGGGGGTGGGGG